MAKCEYPDDEWGEEFSAYLDAPIRYLPADWRGSLSLPDPPGEAAEADECAQLARIVLQRPKHRAAIEAEAESRIAAVYPVLKVIDPYGPPARPRTLELVRVVLEEVLAPTFLLKQEFRRGRPRHCCAQPLDPLHPAYPSGHATQAHAVAAALTLVKPEARDALRDAAAGVAFRREVAGLHYPSDSAAGAALGTQLVAMLEAQPGFHDAWVERAIREW